VWDPALNEACYDDRGAKSLAIQWPAYAAAGGGGPRAWYVNRSMMIPGIKAIQ